MKKSMLISAQFSEFLSTEKNLAVFFLGAVLSLYYSNFYLRFSNFIGKSVNPLECYIVIGSSKVPFTCCILLCLLLLTFDMPNFSGRSTLEIVRVGKKDWLTSKISFLLLLVLLYSTFSLLITVLISVASSNLLIWGEWSGTMNELIGPGKTVALNRFRLFFDYPTFIKNCSVWRAATITFLFNYAYCLVLALIMMFGNIMLNSTKGWIIAIGIHVLNFVISNNGNGVIFNFSFSLLDCALPAGQFGTSTSTNVAISTIAFAALIYFLLLPTKWLQKRLVP